MRIALVGHNPNKIGGIMTFSRTLKKEVFTDIEFIYEYGEQDIFETDVGIAAVKYNFTDILLNKILNNYTKNKIYNILVSQHYDIYMLNSPKYLEASPDLTKTILIQHTTVKNRWHSDYYFNKNQKLLKLARKVAKIIALSEKEASAISTLLDVEQQRIEVINFSAGIPFLDHEKLPGKNLVMLVRYQNEIKRIDLVINAMELLPDFTLNIYGDGKDKNYLIDLARNFQNVHIHTSTTEKAKVLDENHIYVLSSEFEGYPISVIEAISRRLPVVARNTFCSASDLVKDNGILLDREWSQIEFKNAVVECYENYSKYSNNASKYFYKYDLYCIKLQWIQLVQSVYQN